LKKIDESQLGEGSKTPERRLGEGENSKTWVSHAGSGWLGPEDEKVLKKIGGKRKRGVEDCTKDIRHVVGALAKGGGALKFYTFEKR